MRRFSALLLAVLLAGLAVRSQAADDAITTPRNSEATPVVVTPDPLDSVVLGLVEGITEFLPISSTGHLVIATHLLGLETDTVIGVDRKGREVTMKDAADTYVVVIQIGAIAAVALLYWSQISRVLAGLAGRDPAGLRLLRNLFLACVPPAITALLFQKFIKAHLFSVFTVAWALLVGAAIMWTVERWRRRRDASAPVGAYSTELTAADLTPLQALAVGFAQCLSLWPGMSRSMTAMVGCYLVGLRPVRAAEFSFLVGLPLLGAAGLKDAWSGGGAVITAFGWTNVVIGLVVAFISAALAVRLFVGFLTRHGLAVFALYRVALGVVLLAMFWR